MHFLFYLSFTSPIVFKSEINLITFRADLLVCAFETVIHKFKSTKKKTKQNCGSALLARVTYVRVMFQTWAIVFHAVSFSLAFSLILDTGLNFASVIYQLQSLCSCYVSIFDEGAALVELYLLIFIVSYFIKRR